MNTEHKNNKGLQNQGSQDGNSTNIPIHTSLKTKTRTNKQKNDRERLIVRGIDPWVDS